VTAAGQTHPLPAPFFVLATQNPIEQEGTYPLPEAQLDRFMFELRVAYPTKEEEETIVEATTGDRATEIDPVLTRKMSWRCSTWCAASRCRSRWCARGDAGTDDPTRGCRGAGVREAVRVVGAGPRASQYLILGAKARAALDGRPMPDEDDLRTVASTC